MLSGQHCCHVGRTCTGTTHDKALKLPAAREREIRLQGAGTTPLFNCHLDKVGRHVQVFVPLADACHTTIGFVSGPLGWRAAVARAARRPASGTEGRRRSEGTGSEVLNRLLAKPYLHARMYSAQGQQMSTLHTASRLEPRKEHSQMLPTCCGSGGAPGRDPARGGGCGRHDPAPHAPHAVPPGLHAPPPQPSPGQSPGRCRP